MYKNFNFEFQINGDGGFDFDEFLRITRHVESDFYLKYKRTGLKLIFGNFSKEDEESKEFIIDPKDFSRLCKEHKIYSLKSQNLFLEQAEKKGFAKNIEILKENWYLIKSNLSKQ